MCNNNFVLLYVLWALVFISPIIKIIKCEIGESNEKYDENSSCKSNQVQVPNIVNQGRGRYCEIFDNPSVPQDSPVIKNYLREFHLSPPSGKPYIQSKKSQITRSVYTNYIANLFKTKINGFYIEAGAYDGVFKSNTLVLEEKLNWSGLLIEPDPFALVKLRSKMRNAWIADVCMSLDQYPEKTKFLHPTTKHLTGQGILSKTKSFFKKPSKRGEHDLTKYVDAGSVECFPLYSVLSALNRTVVDYFSLDVEGAELKVLQTIPFDKLTIKVMTIEHKWIPEGLDSLIQFLQSKNYMVFRNRKTSYDIFVVHKDYRHEVHIEE